MTAGRAVPEIKYEYHRPGKEKVVYTELLVIDRPDVKVLLQERFSGEDVVRDGRLVLEHGAPIIWFVFAESWHDIGRFHVADGSFTGWYTNLSQPVEFKDDTTWVGRDLCLDLWQPVPGDPTWLDEDEFEAAASSGLLDNATKRRALNERALIDLQLRQGLWPPQICRDIGLAQVQSLLNT